MVGYSTTATTALYPNDSTGDTTVDYYVPNDYYTYTLVGVYDTSEPENIVIIVDTQIESYIERILKLAKWYIIYTFNCFMIRAPC